MEDLDELKQLTKVELKNLDKIFYPQVNVTKGQVIEYYIKMAPKLLPLIHSRPLVLTRYPNGIENVELGKGSFFEKNAPEGTPKWVKTHAIYSSISKRDVNYICLLYTSDAADEEDSVDLGGRRIIKK